VYPVVYVSVDNILMCICEVHSILYKGVGILFMLWEKALSIGLDVSFYNRAGKEWKRKQGKLIVQKLI
jgi:hypothetical protein